jgi:nuclear pore complex protein Nup205
LQTNALLEKNDCQNRFQLALKDGAFDFLLSLTADVKSQAWHDPARHGLRIWLQRQAPPVIKDSVGFSDYFQETLMEQIEGLVEGFITNLPDVLRKMRTEEDQQRHDNTTHDHDLDLERFLVIMSYAYDSRPKAAFEAFWDAPDGALMGFLVWASRRASTPLVSAFCELLQSISEDDDCATAAHQFLLDEGSGRSKRTNSLTWDQITQQLDYFCNSIRDRPSAPQTYGQGKPSTAHSEVGPESFMMLECYLRVIARLCGSSSSARLYFAQHQKFHLAEFLLQLTSSSIESAVKACAFTTLRSLLSHKTKEVSDHLWTSLDLWVSGGFYPGSNTSKASAPAGTAFSARRILKGLGTGFEMPHAFIQLLCALVSPSDDRGLSDGLPFPENIGSSTRMPGIEPYIDWALEDIFSAQNLDVTDVSQKRLLHLACLDFIATCLDTFNEDLVVFANRTNIVVDNAIQTSSLKSYVLLHPFARVMEWMLSEKAVNALFSIVHQDPALVGHSEPDSPLVLCILRGIHVVSLILDLQPTYLDIVRPLLKQQSSYQQIPISNASYASFEDGILNHLSIIADLGLYCGAGQPELILASLRLLEKLSASAQLASAAGTGIGKVSDRDKVISAFEVNGDSEAVSRSLLHEMKANIDPNQGPEDSTYVIKIQILDFLIACLKASPGQPTIAHLLLGFACRKSSIYIASGSPLDQGISLLHAILFIVRDEGIGEDINAVSYWLVAYKYKALQVLSQLWQAPLSSTIVMDEMRQYHMVFPMFLAQTPLTPETFFDGRALGDPDLFASPNASCISDFLRQRAVTLQYISTELQQVAHQHSPALKSRIITTLLGSTTDEDGQTIENSTIFDMFDFIEVDVGQEIEVPFLPWFVDIDLSVFLDDQDENTTIHNLVQVKELLLLRRAELVKEKLLDDPQDAELVDTQMEEFMYILTVNNQLKRFMASRLKLLQSWVQLALMMIEISDLKGSAKIGFVLRTLQTIIPSLENRLDNGGESLELAKLAKALVFSLDFDSESFKQGDMGDLVSDRLFHLYQVSLRAINSLGAEPVLKEVFYNIGYRYLTGMSDMAGSTVLRRRHNIKTIKAAGERFIELICDDAHSGEPLCRISALLLLGALVKMAEKENSKYIVDSLSRLNFITILVGSIQNFPTDLVNTPRECKLTLF